LLGMQSYADAVVGVPGVGKYIPHFLRLMLESSALRFNRRSS
jgi:hypothetical protein